MIARHCRVSLSRRLCTALAALGLLFAATVASVTHSLAMPMMDSGMTVSHQQHGSPVAATSAATAEHDCASSMAADESPVSPLSSSPPCAQGCLLCTNCALTGVVLPAGPAMIAALPYHAYAPAGDRAPAGLGPTQPNEPPRR